VLATINDNSTRNPLASNTVCLWCMTLVSVPASALSRARSHQHRQRDFLFIIRAGGGYPAPDDMLAICIASQFGKRSASRYTVIINISRHLPIDMYQEPPTGQGASQQG
jgi:hypothetical protein